MNLDFNSADTIAGIATSTTGIGAVGIIRISGPDALSVAGKLFFQNGKRRKDFKSHKLYYGHIYAENVLLDEVFAVCMKAPKSYTREDVCEIHCHGGTISLRRVLDAVLSAGARPAAPGEFTKRAFLNGRIDLTEAEAIMDVISASSYKAHTLSQKALEGNLSGVIYNVYENLLTEIAAIETLLDNPSHAIGVIEETYDTVRLTETLSKISANLNKTHKTFEAGRILKHGINTAIIGRPNVGKSSLLNALLGKERAIVTDIAGTTRDTLNESVVVGNSGVILNITDTAGIRDNSALDPVEEIGVLRAKETLREAELILFVMDGSVEIINEDLQIFKEATETKSHLICVLNKADLPKAFDSSSLNAQNIVSVSAKTGQGINDLISEIENLALKDFNGSEDVVITSARHANLLGKAIADLDTAISAISTRTPEDLIAADLTSAAHHLGEIIGKNVSEEIIDTIFSKFCIGK